MSALNSPLETKAALPKSPEQCLETGHHGRWNSACNCPPGGATQNPRSRAVDESVLPGLSLSYLARKSAFLRSRSTAPGMGSAASGLILTGRLKFCFAMRIGSWTKRRNFKRGLARIPLRGRAAKGRFRNPKNSGPPGKIDRPIGPNTPFSTNGKEFMRHPETRDTSRTPLISLTLGRRRLPRSRR